MTWTPITTTMTKNKPGYDYPDLTITEYRVYVALVRKGGGYAPASSMAGIVGIRKTSAARALSSLVSKRYVTRYKTTVVRTSRRSRRRKTETQVSQRRSVYKYSINRYVERGVFRNHPLYINKIETEEKTKPTKTPSIRSYKYYNYKRGQKIARYIARRDMVKRHSRQARQAELIDVGERRKPRRKSRAGELMKIVNEEHRKAFGIGAFMRAKPVDFIFINKEIDRIETHWLEAYRESSEEARREMLADPAFGDMLKSKMTPVRFLAWAVRELYAGPIKERAYPFEQGFQSVKYLIYHAVQPRMMCEYIIHCREEARRERMIHGSRRR